MKWLFLFGFTWFSALVNGAGPEADERELSRIAFGSCNNPRTKDHSIYEGILRCKPDLFIFLGDNIYGDTTYMEVMKKKYSALAGMECFRKLR